MINCVGFPQRYQYIVKTGRLKKDNTSLNAEDYINIGYMAGRFGVNLQNPCEANPILKNGTDLYVNINSCTAPLFESNLNQAGILFDRIA